MGQYTARAQASGVGVIVCNHNYGGAQHFSEHVEAALNDVVLRATASALSFVVHSAAGLAILEALAKCLPRCVDRIAGIAFLDSAHRLPRLPPSNLENWLCDFCSAENPLQRRFCHLCRSRKPDMDVTGGWVCSFCSAENRSHRRSCKLCQSPKPEGDGIGGQA